jgi:DNA polymerase
LVTEKVHRCFASNNNSHGSLYKKNRNKYSIDKTPSTPDRCFIINEDITNMPIPKELDKQWYIDEAKKRIENFLK